MGWSHILLVFFKKTLISHDIFSTFISFPLKQLWNYFLKKLDFTNEAFCWYYLGHDLLCFDVPYFTLFIHNPTNYLATLVRKYYPWHLYYSLGFFFYFHFFAVCVRALVLGSTITVDKSWAYPQNRK